MIFILPFKTSIRPTRTPYTNYVLIAINVAVFVLQSFGGDKLNAYLSNFMLHSATPHLWQFISYAFMHSNIWHILGNMFFLYLFGNNVNDELGHVGYTSFYLAGAVFSGIGHSLLSSNPVLGASGAVAAVTGAYLVLFPQTLITVLYLIFYIFGTMELSALYFIAFKMIVLDNIIARTTQNVAYDAHLSGYVFGIASILIMLATGLIGSTNFDLWTMIKQWNRRRIYRDMVACSQDPFTGVKKVRSKQVKVSAAEKEKLKKIEVLRGQIAGRISDKNLPAASRIYLELMDTDDKQILAQQHLLDIANQLMSDNKFEYSAMAYEQFLDTYNGYEYIEQVQLMLGIIYARYIHRPQMATKHLEAAILRLTDPDQIKMCREQLNRLKN